MEILIAVLGSSALASCISGIFNLIALKTKKTSGLEEGVRILLYKYIKDACCAAINRGFITSDEYEDLIKMHSVYHNALNGNGYLDTEMEDVKQLLKHSQGGTTSV